MSIDQSTLLISLTEENKSLKEQVEKLTTSLQQVNLYSLFRTYCYHFCIGFFTFCPSSVMITGPILYNFFNFDKNDFSYPQTDCTIYFTENTTINEKWVCKRFFHIVNQIIKNPSLNIAGFYCTNFQIDSLHYSIPEVKLIFTKENMNISVIFKAWINKQYVPNTSVENIAFTVDGFKEIIPSSNSFIGNLTDIGFKQAKINKPIFIYQQKAFPSHTSVSRDIKQKYCKQLYTVIKESLIPLSENGFAITGLKPKITYEFTDDCSITGCKPIYPVVTLECNHKISLMSYKGILENRCGDTESMRCPMCRENLSIKFITEVEPKYIPVIKCEENTQDIPKIKSSFINKEALEQL